MTFDIISVLIFIIIVVILCNGVSDYRKKKDKKDRVNISFKESMDLTELPIITFYNNGSKFNFLLDTGANRSAIDSNILNTLSYKDLNMSGSVYGMEGNKNTTHYVTASLEYKNRFYEDDFQVLDMSAAFNQIKAESGVSLSGILGSLFFQKYRYVLDFNDLIAYSKK